MIVIRGKEGKRVEKELLVFDRMKQKGKARAGYFSARRKVGLLESLQIEIGCKLNKVVAIEHNSVEMMLVVMLSVQKSEVAAVAIGRPGRRGLPCVGEVGNGRPLRPPERRRARLYVGHRQAQALARVSLCVALRLG